MEELNMKADNEARIFMKDAEPKDTVNKIKDILQSIKCVTTEKWTKSIEDIYSVRIEIEGTRIGANGKGVSKELALASGYGELIERLQNLINFRMTSVFGRFIKEKNTYVFPDQIVRKEIKLTKKEKSWFQEVINGAEVDDINYQLYEFSEGEVIELPYFNMDSAEEMLVPYVLADLFYGSNGMAAGNTREEAFVQGISEIFERYVVKKIIANEYSELRGFPEITTYVCNSYPWIGEILTECEERGYKTHILDMSLDTNLPVVATIFMNQEKMNYFVNFGCHPLLEIAVERTVSELLQGRDIDSISGMTNIEEDMQSVAVEKNRNSIFTNGIGVYPYNLFGMKPEKPSDVWMKKYRNNTDMLKRYVEILKNMGKEIYYRDVSFLGFPTYHIIIPGISEITCDREEVYRFFEIQKLARTLCDVNNVDTKRIVQIIDLLDSANPISTITAFDIMQLPLRTDENNVLMDITVDMLLMMASAYISDYLKASKYTKRYLKYLDENEAANDIKKYYKTILAIFNMKQNKLAKNDIVKILSEILSYEYISEVVDDLEPENVFNYFPRVKCFECEQCILRNSCCFEKEAELYRILMSRAEKYMLK